MVIKNKLQMKITILTSVHIWSGEEVRKDIDYCYHRNEVYLLDIYKLSKPLIKSGYKLDDLPRLIQNKIRSRCPPSDGVIKEKLITFDDLSRVESIKRHVKIGGKVVIPGSTIKGLIRTALLYKLCSNVRNYITGKVVNNLHNLNTLVLMGDRRGASREVKKVAEPVEELLKIKINDFMVDVLNRLIVSDPVSCKVKNVIRIAEVYEIRGQSIHLIANNPLEVVDKDSTLTYELTILESNKFSLSKLFNIDLELKSLQINLSNLIEKYSQINTDMIIDSLREFSRELLKSELNKIKNIKELKDYKEFLENLQKKLENGGNTFYFKIGLMSGHLFKTVDLMLNPETKDLLNRVMSVYFSMITRGKIKVWDDKTVKVVKINGKHLGIGWVEVQLI